MSGELAIAMGSTEGASCAVRTDGVVEVDDRLAGNVLRGRIAAGWTRVIVRTTGEAGSKRAFLLEPSEGEDELAFGPFFVRGRFVIARKANSPRAAEELWRSLPPPKR